MILQSGVTDTLPIYLYGEGGGARNIDPYIENYSNIIINMRKV
jgi:hypothetical protein